jgi:hypothetical protein
MIKFKSMRVADVSTKHITARDGQLISNPNAPHSVAEVHGGYGTFFHTNDDCGDMDGSLRSAGFSDEFIRIMRLAALQGCDYVRFDSDGEDYAGLPEFEW